MIKSCNNNIANLFFLPLDILMSTMWWKKQAVQATAWTLINLASHTHQKKPLHVKPKPQSYEHTALWATMLCWRFHSGTVRTSCSCPPPHSSQLGDSKSCTSYSRSSPKWQPLCLAAKVPASGTLEAMRWPCASGLPCQGFALEGAHCMSSLHPAWERLHGFWPR